MTGPLAILGGCGGIGRALTEAAAEAGYEPIVLDLPASIAAHPPTVRALPVDATSEAELAQAAAQLPGDLAGFVTLAGFVSESLPVAQMPARTWREVLDGNLNASFLAVRSIAPRIRDGGAIVLTGSGLGHFARPGYGPYAVAKAGIAALNRQFALELAPRVRVNCVAPSAVDTAFLRGGTGRSGEDRPTRFDVEAYGKAIPLGRIAVPDDIVGPMLFLLSDMARYVTGQTLHVNGGAYMP